MHLQNLGIFTLTPFGTPSHYYWTHPHATKTRQRTPSITATLTPEYAITTLHILHLLATSSGIHNPPAHILRSLPSASVLSKSSTLQSLSVASRTQLHHHNYSITLLLNDNNQPQPHQATMFSCANYERGCRGRCNRMNGRCDSCHTLNLQVRSNSASSTSSTNGLPSAAYSAMTNSFASLSQLNSQSSSTRAQ